MTGGKGRMDGVTGGGGMMGGVRLVVLILQTTLTWLTVHGQIKSYKVITNNTETCTSSSSSSSTSLAELVDFLAFLVRPSLVLFLLLEDHLRSVAEVIKTVLH